MKSEHYDVFLSHANKDKLDFVNDLKKSFDLLGISVFYDTDVLRWGDNWKDRIMYGVNHCDFAVIVISDNFFGREWTEKELKALLLRQSETGKKLVLPVLYNTTARKIKNRYPMLGDIHYISSRDMDVKDITIRLASVLLDARIGSVRSDSDIELQLASFFKGRTVQFFEWLAKIVDGNNDFVDEYETEMIGWDSPSIDGMQLLQRRGDMYRVNPKFYNAFKRYFDREIRPQIL